MKIRESHDDDDENALHMTQIVENAKGGSQH